MYKSEKDIVIDKINQYEDVSEVTYDKFSGDVLTAYNLKDNAKAQKLMLKAWRNTRGLRNALEEFDYYLELIR